MSYNKLKMAALGCALIGGLATLAGGFFEVYKTEAQINEEVEKRLAENFEEEEEAETEEEP